MKETRHTWKYIVVSIMMMLTFVLFIVGLFFNYDGAKIILNSKNYSPGLLEVDSIFAGPAGTGAEPGLTAYAEGYADSVRTTLQIGLTGIAYVDSILHRFVAKEEPVLLPVWYKQDGRQTIDRNIREKDFPFWNMLLRLIMYISLFNVPFLLFWYLQRKIKKKYKID